MFAVVEDGGSRAKEAADRHWIPKVPTYAAFQSFSGKNHIRADIQAKADWRCFGLVKNR